MDFGRNGMKVLYFPLNMRHAFCGLTKNKYHHRIPDKILRRIDATDCILDVFKMLFSQTFCEFWIASHGNANFIT